MASHYDGSSRVGLGAGKLVVWSCTYKDCGYQHQTTGTPNPCPKHNYIPLQNPRGDKVKVSPRSPANPGNSGRRSRRGWRR